MDGQKCTVSNCTGSYDGGFCDVCGAAAPQGASSAALPVAAPAGKIACPQCSEPHNPQEGDFCDVCGWNFVTGQAAKAVLPAPTAQVSTPAPVPATAGATTAASYEAVVKVDKTQTGAPDQPDARFDLFEVGPSEQLLGRLDNNHPDIPVVGDSGVSRKHAVVTLHTDGSLTVRDNNSTNGTILRRADGSSKELAPGVEEPLAPGDELVVGAWTIVQVRAR